LIKKELRRVKESNKHVNDHSSNNRIDDNNSITLKTSNVIISKEILNKTKSYTYKARNDDIITNNHTNNNEKKYITDSNKSLIENKDCTNFKIDIETLEKRLKQDTISETKTNFDNFNSIPAKQETVIKGIHIPSDKSEKIINYLNNDNINLTNNNDNITNLNVHGTLESIDKSTTATKHLMFANDNQTLSEKSMNIDKKENLSSV